MDTLEQQETTTNHRNLFKQLYLKTERNLVAGENNRTTKSLNQEIIKVENKARNAKTVICSQPIKTKMKSIN